MYLHQLLKNIEFLESSFRYELIVPKLDPGRYLPRTESLSYQIIPNLRKKMRRIFRVRDIWWRILVPFHYKLHKSPDLFVSAINVGPPLSTRVPYVAVAHDLDYIEYPYLYSHHRREKNALNTAQSIKKATHIIAISEATKQQVVKFFDYDPDAVSVIHHGYDRGIFNPRKSPENDCGETIRAKFKIDRKYLLMVGSMAPKKNIEIVIRAIRYLKEKNRQLDFQLLLCGSSKMQDESTILDEIQKANLHDEFVLTGFVSDQEMGALYREAEAFLFPSLAEGFGLPLVEAMASGCPIVTSNTSCMPEITADAALHCSPTDAREWAYAITRILSDHTLRTDLVRKGHDRAKAFAWEDTAARTVEVFARAVRGER